MSAAALVALILLAVPGALAEITSRPGPFKDLTTYSCRILPTTYHLHRWRQFDRSMAIHDERHAIVAFKQKARQMPTGPAELIDIDGTEWFGNEP